MYLTKTNFLMKKNLFTIICILTFYASAFSQNSLLFLNTNTNQTIEVTVGQTLSVQYKGYNNQIYYYKNVVTEINDSSIMLGYPSNELPVWAQKLSKKFEPNYRTINTKDIVSFRRITAGRTLGKSLIASSISIGTYITSFNLLRNSGLTELEYIFISMGIGIVTTGLNSFILPENPKYKISENWVITVRK